MLMETHWPRFRGEWAGSGDDQTVMLANASGSITWLSKRVYT